MSFYIAETILEVAAGDLKGTSVGCPGGILCIMAHLPTYDSEVPYSCEWNIDLLILKVLEQGVIHNALVPAVVCALTAVDDDSGKKKKK